MKWYNPEMEPLARLKYLIRYSTHGNLLTRIKQPYQYHLVPYLGPWTETPSPSAICSLASRPDEVPIFVRAHLECAKC